MRRAIIVQAGLAVSLLHAGTAVHAQRPTLSQAVRQFVSVDTPVVALIHARVIDGTGAPARANQTLIIRDGNIAAVGNDGLTIPPGARVIDLTGKSVVPGLVHMHEHLNYPNGAPGGVGYSSVATSFSRLYLAAGVTSIRTAGTLFPITEIKHKQHIDAGTSVGPWIDVTSPIIDGEGGVPSLLWVKTPDEAARAVNYWIDAGATSIKVYKNITRDQLRAAINAARARGIKLTGDLCSVTWREAAEMGIDNVEHGLFVPSDFLPNKRPDVCTGGQGAIWPANAALDLNSAPVRDLIKFLVDRNVAFTSTLPVLEAMTPGRMVPGGLDLLTPQLRERVSAQYNRSPNQAGGGGRGGQGGGGAMGALGTLFPKILQFERMFAQAGGFVMAGTDPTGVGSIIPGWANHRQIELQVEAGFTPLEAIKISTMNGATYLGRANRIGSIAAGKQADLVVVNGDPSTRISDIRNVEIVFKQGVGYDPTKLVESVRGFVGLW